ncbi:DUF3311 domain-containing protein [Sinorhizobium fredii]|uniref:DUF3311 domain-containing protein n=1 Tax=Rhizobium fredii TaxID=380 RepID=A0A2A6LSE5_RHIFR|nr:DUF3311 domain-containing protein [Sinorhizobium fredii]
MAIDSSSGRRAGNRTHFSSSRLVQTSREDNVIRLLLLAPYIGLLWVPFYNFEEPKLFGFPFFYWYQLAWVPLTSLLTYFVYRSVRHDG